MMRKGREKTPLHGGHFAAELYGFQEWLSRRGFSETTSCRHVSRVASFLRYLTTERIADLKSVESSHLSALLETYLSKQDCRRHPESERKRLLIAVRRFREYMASRGVTMGHKDVSPTHQSILDGYARYLRRYRNATQTTVDQRTTYARIFLRELLRVAGADTPAGLSTSALREILTEYAESHGDGAIHNMNGSLRSFLPFCQREGYVDGDLAASIPRGRRYKLDRTPRTIAEEEIERLIRSMDGDSAAGFRDLAIIRLLNAYGVRGGHVRGLQLSDIDWRQSRLRLRAMKRGRDILLPLTEEVGRSLLDYLRKGRPQSAFPHVFLTIRPPIRPLSHRTLSEIVFRRMRAAGIRAPSMGAHIFRHSFASRMLRDGQSLKAIADLLGHRSIGTTFVYTKIDLSTLRKVALSWPEEPPWTE